MTHLPSSPTPIKAPKLRLGLWRVVLLLGLGLLTITFLLALGGGRDAITALIDVNLAWIGVGILVHYSGFVVRGWRWQQLLRALGHRLTWRESMTLLLSGWFVSALLPARAGDFLRIALLRTPTATRAPVSVADSTGSIVLERAFDLLALVVLGAGVGFTLLRTQMPGWIVAAYGTTVVLLGLATVALLIAPRLLEWLRPRTAHPLWHKALDLAAQLVQSLRMLGTAPGLAFVIFGESLYIWLCDGILMWAVLQAMGIDAPWATITFVALTVDIFAAVPITPGGIGQIEAVNVALLSLLPLPAFNLAAAVLLNRAISYWSFLLFSGIVTFIAGIGQVMTTRPDSQTNQVHPMGTQEGTSDESAL